VLDNFQLHIIASILTGDTCSDEQCEYFDGPNTDLEPELLSVQGYDIHSLQ
jgi:hypothetical protein